MLQAARKVRDTHQLYWYSQTFAVFLMTITTSVLAAESIVQNNSNDSLKTCAQRRHHNLSRNCTNKNNKVKKSSSKNCY